MNVLQIKTAVVTKPVVRIRLEAIFVLVYLDIFLILTEGHVKVNTDIEDKIIIVA